MPTPVKPSALVKTYLDRVEKDLKAGTATEHTHRAALSTLIEGLLPGVHATNEPKRGKYGAPDYLITRGEKTLGYGEAKDVGVSLSDTEKGEQIGRYRAALPNLLLTDYLEFRWYVDGEKREATATLGEWSGGKLKRNPDGPDALLALLTGFAEQSPQAIKSALELARRMARLTRLVHDMVREILETNEASNTLKGLMKAFRGTILPSLTENEFADMYAQTLAYGLFAARVAHKGTSFTRQDAARSIPKTNPLLQKLFYTLTGPDLDDEPYVTLIDDLAALLAQADMTKILSEFGTANRQEDPIVHFYETFLTQYDPRLREQRGVYYTPTPVVDYIVRSVDALLKRDFGLSDGLGDTEKTTFTTSDDRGLPVQKEVPRLLIMDPATGTGTFPYQIIRLLRERFAASESAGQWPAYVREHLIHALYGFELMMAPYAVAHLKLSMELEGLDMPTGTEEEQEQQAEQAVKLQERLNVYLTNTLDDPMHETTRLSGPFQVISDEAALAGRIKADYPLMVVLGNPPYSGHSANNSQWIDDLLKGTVRMKGKIDKARRTPGNYYEVDGKPLGERNSKWLQDDYVKFIRWAQWRVEQTGAGIVAFITPHGYLDNPTFRGMRQSLMGTFDDLYVLDLHGNANKKEKAPDGSTDQNVFDIRTGVAIGIFVRRAGTAGARAGKVHRADLWGVRASKYDWLVGHDVLSGGYTTLTPTREMYLWTDRNASVEAEYETFWHLLKISSLNVMGFQTHRDDFAIDFERKEIEKRMEDFRSNQADEDLLRKYSISDNRDWNISRSRKDIKSKINWSSNIHQVSYRPFDTRWSYYGYEAMDYPRTDIIENILNKHNICLGVGRQGSAISENEWQLVTISNLPMDANIYRRGGVNIFPLYIYPNNNEATLLSPSTTWPIDSLGRTPNLGKPFIEALSAATSLTFAPGGAAAANEYSPEDVFSYVYAVLHSPSYRARYADFLRSDFPRIPLPDSAERFRALAALGAQLTDQHLLKTAAKLGGFPKAGSNEVAKGYPKFNPPETGKTEGKVMISPTQWFSGVTPEVWEFRVGGYQVAEKWLKDRRGRVLTLAEQTHYQRALGALAATITLMEQVDEAIEGLISI